MGRVALALGPQQGGMVSMGNPGSQLPLPSVIVIVRGSCSCGAGWWLSTSRFTGWTNVEDLIRAGIGWSYPNSFIVAGCWWEDEAEGTALQDGR